MRDIEIFGQLDQIPDDMEPNEKLIVRMQPIDLVKSWNRCGLTADYIAGYYSGISNNLSGILGNTISTVLNELIENAAKFSMHNDSLVTITVKNFINLLLIEVENDVSLLTGDRFREYLEFLKGKDFSNLYFDRLEKRKENDSSSGLGILMILKDYSASFAVKFVPKEKNGNEYYEITIKILLSIEG